MSEFEQARARRRRFLRAAYELGKSRPARMVSLADIAGEMGMDPGDDELTDTAMYYDEQGYMRKHADGYGILSITAAGVDEVESGEPAPQTWGDVLYSGTRERGDDAMREKVPPAIQNSLREFKKDHPDPAKVAFILMQFGRTEAHRKITEAIKDALAVHGIIGVRADDKEYHEDLFPNVQTYLHGCGLGVAVFERIEAEKFNPNVSLEVGYMFAMDKRVCLLKDRTLPTLQADLVGKLYREFEPQDPSGTIPPALTAWLTDRGLSKS
jgi:hypothetical protein